MAQAVFYVNGVQKYSANCGDSLVFDIPGYPSIWMTQYQNGILQYDGPQTLPTSPLALTCPPDEGVFQGTAYEMINGQKGNQITSWTFQIVNPTNASQPPAGVPPTGTGPGGTSTCATGLCTATPPPPPPPAPPPGATTIPVPTSTGGPGGSTATTVPSGSGGLNPNGDLPGTIPPATANTGGPGQGTSGATPGPSSMTAFNLQGFIQSPIFWLLLVLLALVYFMSE